MKKTATALLLAIVAWGGVPAPTIGAATCPMKLEQIFQRAAYAQGDPVPIYTQGAQARILFVNNDLDENCDSVAPSSTDDGVGGTRTVKTSHISASGSYMSSLWCKQVEIGSIVAWDNDGASSNQSMINKDRYVFTEWQNTCDPGIKDISSYKVQNYYQEGTDDIFRISGDRQGNGDEQWTLEVNFLSSGPACTWCQYAVYTTTSWNSGTPSGETERFAGSNPGTGMGSEFTAMKYKQGSWLAWAWNVCEQHRYYPQTGTLPARWAQDRTADDAFDVVLDTSPPTC